MTQQTIGLVNSEVHRLALSEAGFALDKGGALAEVEVAYEAYGKLNDAKDNAILICHALTGDAHAAGKHDMADRKPGWWEYMIGPGKGIDTDRYYVVCANILGGCMGTTGPSSTNPATGKPYGLDFPEITIGDMVRAQKHLLNDLGIEKLYGVIGGSAGGIQVLEWVVSYPELVGRAICIAAAESLSAQALAFDIVARKIIMNDPAWHGGDYYGKDTSQQGLALARMIAHITYLSQESMASKFGRERRDDIKAGQFSTDFQVESYLNYQGESFVGRFDPNSYLYITQAMNNFGLRERADSLEDVFKPFTGHLMFISLSSDWLYPSQQSHELASALQRAGKKVTYFELQSDYGHDAFLIENQELTDVMNTFLTGESGACSVSDSILQSRRDLAYMFEAMPEGSKVLDLGCGEGNFLAQLFDNKNVSGHGIDIDVTSICGCNRKAIPVFQADISRGLTMIPDNSYDVAILSCTLQELQNPEFVIGELLRVAKQAWISMPNFANWRHRLRMLSGRLPRNPQLPYEWYNTPNIHFVTIEDFKLFVAKKGYQLLDLHGIADPGLGETLTNWGFPNAGAESFVARISR